MMMDVYLHVDGQTSRLKQHPRGPYMIHFLRVGMFEGFEGVEEVKFKGSRCLVTEHQTVRQAIGGMVSVEEEEDNSGRRKKVGEINELRNFWENDIEN